MTLGFDFKEFLGSTSLTGTQVFIKLILRRSFNGDIPMSHAGAILGIKELIIEEVKRRDSIEMWAKPTKRQTVSTVIMVN